MKILRINTSILHGLAPLRLEIAVRGFSWDDFKIRPFMAVTE